MLQNDYISEAESISAELYEWRHAFHRHPELGNHEFKTAERIESCLKSLGVETKRLLDTAVIGCLHGSHAGPTAAFRADMDALPVTETTGASYASVCPGVMHACGHDTHITAALGAAKLLSAHREMLHGDIVFIFQPDEEGNGGAERLIRSGVLENVSCIFGSHVTPDLPEGHIGIRYGKFYAASDTFRAMVHGISCHGAEREKGIDPILAASEMITSIIALPAVNNAEKSVVSVGTIHAGTAGNIIAENAEFSGIIRTLGQQNRQTMCQLLSETIRRISDNHGTSTELELRQSYPGVVNHDDMTDLVRAAACRLFGNEKVHLIGEPTMTTEDFGYYLLERPGCFYHFGAGSAHPLHSANFLPDDHAVVTASAVHAAVLEAALSDFGIKNDHVQ